MDKQRAGVEKPGRPLMVVPRLPERGLGGNTREDWRAKGSLVAAERVAFGLEVRSLVPRSRWPVFTKKTTVRIRWVVYVEEWRGDWDNFVMALKPWQDSLVDIGLLPKDGPKVLRGGSVEVVKAKPARVELYLDVEESESIPLDTRGYRVYHRAVMEGRVIYEGVPRSSDPGHPGQAKGQFTGRREL